MFQNKDMEKKYVIINKEMVEAVDFKLVIETKVISWNRGIAKGEGVAYTNGEVACEAEMMITIPDILDQYLPQKKQNSERV